MNFLPQKPLYFPQFDDDFFNLFRIHLDEGSVPDCEGIHRHTFTELLYCRSNCGAVFQLNNRDYSLQRGDILLVPPGIPHGWLQRSNSMDPYMGYRICIDPSAAELLLQFPPHTDFRLAEQPFIRTCGTIWEFCGDLFRVLYEETHFRTIGWQSSAFAAALSLQTCISRALHYTPTMPITQEKSDFYQSVLSYVTSNLANKLTLEDIAQRFWVSPSTITNLFNRHAGTSFYKFVTTMRLAEAKILWPKGCPWKRSPYGSVSVITPPFTGHLRRNFPFLPGSSCNPLKSKKSARHKAGAFFVLIHQPQDWSAGSWSASAY